MVAPRRAIEDVIRDMPTQPSRTIEVRSIDAAVRQLPSLGPSLPMPQRPQRIYIGQEAVDARQPRITSAEHESDSDQGSDEELFKDAQEDLTEESKIT